VLFGLTLRCEGRILSLAASAGVLRAKSELLSWLRGRRRTHCILLPLWSMSGFRPKSRSIDSAQGEVWDAAFAPGPRWQRWLPNSAPGHAEQTAQNPEPHADSVPECAGSNGQRIPRVNIPPRPADAGSCLCTKT